MAVSIIDSLPLNKRDGTIITSDTDWQIYVGFFFGSMLFYALLTMSLDVILGKYREAYMALDRIKQKVYLSNIIANCSHSAVCIFSIYNFSSPDCTDPYPFKWFVDDICFLSVDVKFGCACSMLIGYLVFDFIYATLYVQ